MKVVIQRCKKSSVTVDNKEIASIDKGIILLVGFTDEDDRQVFDYMVDKIVNLRIFDDEDGVMNKSLIDIQGSILSVSQFTLYADTTKGRRPSYIKALNGNKAQALYNEFNEKLKKMGIIVKTGMFGANMEVSLINDGPVTIVIEKGGINER